MFNFNHLYYFYVTARAGSVTGAARALHLSQPALSAQLKVLEGVMGKRIFSRNGRAIVLTPPGRRLYERCRSMFADVDSLWCDFVNTARARRMRVHIAISLEIDGSFIIERLAGLFGCEREAEGQPLFSLSSVAPHEIFSFLKQHIFDCVLVDQPNFDVDIDEVVSEQTPIVLALPVGLCSKSRPEGSKKDLRIVSKFLDERWVLPSRGLRLRGEIDRFLESLGIRPKVVLESDDLSLLSEAVEHRAGGMFIPKRYVEHRFKAARLVQAGPPAGFWRHTLYLYSLRGKERSLPIHLLKHCFF